MPATLRQLKTINNFLCLFKLSLNIIFPSTLK